MEVRDWLRMGEELWQDFWARQDNLKPSDADVIIGKVEYRMYGTVPSRGVIEELDKRGQLGIRRGERLVEQ